jgi:hypothetical protein
MGEQNSGKSSVLDRAAAAGASSDRSADRSADQSGSGDAATDDITQLILDDHETFRRGFARLDDLRAAPPVLDRELTAVWAPLADLLDVHAVAEEEVFYPQLLRSAENAEDETLDAIGDHNDIRDGVRDAGRHDVGSRGWWEAVGRTRAANDEHMAEEEGEGLVDMRRNATPELRASLGRRFREFKAAHDADDLDTSNKDPQDYVSAELPGSDTSTTERPADSSLGIGSLKGR